MPKTCILICTFNRPELLRRLLTALVPQARAQGCMTVIVDNGTRSSEAVVAPWKTWEGNRPFYGAPVLIQSAAASPDRTAPSNQPACSGA